VGCVAAIGARGVEPRAASCSGYAEARCVDAQQIWRIIEPNSPSAGVMVALIEVNGAPVELMQIDHGLRPDL
jgi:hypothetical protein